MKNNYILQAWLVLTLALVFGVSLAAVNNTLSPVIEANKVNETLEKIPELISGKSDSSELKIEPISIEVERGGKKVFYKVFEAKQDGVVKGYVAKSGGQGYADKIELLLGLSPKADEITGLFVLEQKETPGLGNKISTDEWRGQYTGKKTDTALAVVKTGAKNPNEIDSITGATISSKSVTSIINTVISDLKEPLAKRNG